MQMNEHYLNVKWETNCIETLLKVSSAFIGTF